MKLAQQSLGNGSLSGRQHGKRLVATLISLQDWSTLRRVWSVVLSSWKEMNLYLRYNTSPYLLNFATNAVLF